MNSEPGASTAGEVPESMKSADVGYFDENGNWQASDQRVAVSGERPAASQPSTAGQDRLATSTAAAATARNRTVPHEATATSGAKTPHSLPRTSSSLALLELVSGLSIATGFAIRLTAGRHAKGR
jgi:hypothetical protein